MNEMINLINDTRDDLQKFHNIKDYNNDYQFLTVTLAPKMYKCTLHEQNSLARRMLEQILRKYCFHYVLIPELTQQCNVHYHAIIKMRNIRRIVFLHAAIKKLSKLFGHRDLKIIPDLIGVSRVIDYITKDIMTTMKITKWTLGYLITVSHPIQMTPHLVDFTTFKDRKLQENIIELFFSQLDNIQDALQTIQEEESDEDEDEEAAGHEEDYERDRA